MPFLSAPLRIAWPSVSTALCRRCHRCFDWLNFPGPDWRALDLPMPNTLTPARHELGARYTVPPDPGGVVQQSQISQRNSLLQMLQGSRIARQNAIRRHVMTAFGHPLRYSSQQLSRIIDTHHQQHHRKACDSCLLHQCQLGRMRKHRLAHKRCTLSQTGCAPGISPCPCLG